MKQSLTAAFQDAGIARDVKWMRCSVVRASMAFSFTLPRSRSVRQIHELDDLTIRRQRQRARFSSLDRAGF